MNLNTTLREIKRKLKGFCQLCHHHAGKLELDHDHDTELARGFVCSPCNRFVIEAGKYRPELVSPEVRFYLLNPPLASYKFRYKNPTQKKSEVEFYYGRWFHTHLKENCIIKTALRGDQEIARATILETYTPYKATAIVFYQDGRTLETEYTDEKPLMKFIIRNQKA